MNAEHSEIAESGLTDKQERFAHEYLIDQNASAACLRAGYSAHSHAVQAAQLMQNLAVRKRVRGLLEELYARIKLDAQRLMEERMRTAFFDPRRLFDADSQPIPFKELDAECAGVMLVSYDTRSNGDQVTRVKQPSRAAALSALERRFAQFKKLQQEDTITARENADLQLSLGRDPALVAAGGVVRFTPDRQFFREAAQREAAERELKGRAAAPQAQAAAGQRGVVMAAADHAVPVVAAVAVPVAATVAQAVRAPAQPAATMAPPSAPMAPPSAPMAPPSAAMAPPAAAMAPPSAAKVCVPAARVSKSGWADAWGNIDVDHPHIPPEVKARELEKRRRKQAEEAARNNPGLLLNYASSTVGRPNPPWPQPRVQNTQRYAITEDDPFGSRGSDY